MLKSAMLGMLALVCVASSAEARCLESGTVMFPSCMGGDFLAGVKSIRVTMKRERRSVAKNRRNSDQVAQVPFAYSGTVSRPPGCPARWWCGCFLSAHLGISDRSLWVARNWARVGHAAPGPQAGAIVVWPHHVGLIKAAEGNRILVLSGNDGRAVRERWRSVRGVIAYRVAG